MDRKYRWIRRSERLSQVEKEEREEVRENDEDAEEDDEYHWFVPKRCRRIWD